MNVSSVETARPATSARGARAAIIACATLGEYSLLIMPFIVTAMMQAFSLNEVRAGDLVSLQLLAMGLAGCSVSYLVTRVSPRSLVALGAVLVITANGMCALSSVEATLWLGRALTGVGEGTIMAAAGALAASQQSHRLFAALGLVIAMVATAALFATPLLFDHVGPRGVFWLLAMSPLVALVAVWRLPLARASTEELPRLGAIAVPGALLVLSAFALLWIGASALFVFAERIGAAHGLSLAQVGSYLAIGQIVGIAGPLLAAPLGAGSLRAGLLAGSLAMAVAGLVLVYGTSGLSYVLGASLLSLGAMFLVPCFRSSMARLDASGSVVALSVPFYTFGFGIAPILVGRLLSSKSGYIGIAWLAAAAFTLSGVMAILAKPGDQRNTAPSD